MAKLQVKINLAAQTAVFSGPGTFAAKDEIKRLGPARWDGANKAWEVRSLSTSFAELKLIFPELELVELATEAALGDEAPKAIEFPDLRHTFVAAPTVPQSKELQALVAEKFPTGLSVSNFVATANSVLADHFAGGILIYGVVSAVKRVQGRVFLSLADANAPDQSVDCVIWRDEEKVCAALSAAGFQLEKDLQVMFRAKVGLNPKSARVSLTVTEVVAEYTVLKLAAQRELTNKRLIAEGLFGRNKELRLPFLPIRIGILTSGGGTVINDFRAALDVSQFGFELLWLPISVQGAEAKQQILAGLATLQQRSDLDLIVLFRGGGGASELAVFNDYEVAAAICRSKLPVLTAIGHEADQSSAQDVSFRAFGVPKDIGRFFADIIKDLRERFAESVTMIHFHGRSAVDQKLERLDVVASRIGLSGAQAVQHRVEQLEGIVRSLPLAGRMLIEQLRQRYTDTVVPIGVLKRKVLEAQQVLLRERGQSVVWLARIRHGKVHERVVIARERFSRETTRIIQSSEYGLSRFLNLGREAARVLEQAVLKVKALEGQVKEAGPEVQLKRGYTLVSRKSDGKIVTRGEGLGRSEVVEIRFADAVRKAVVE